MSDDSRQGGRQKHEVAERARAIRSGLAGLWDRLTGRRKAMLAEHEKDAWQAAKREQRERDATINAHLKERGKLQERITTPAPKAEP